MFGLVLEVISNPPTGYKSIPIPKSPTCSCKDVTIILPTISTDVEELRQTIQIMLACHPFQRAMTRMQNISRILSSFHSHRGNILSDNLPPIIPALIKNQSTITRFPENALVTIKPEKKMIYHQRGGEIGTKYKPTNKNGITSYF